MISSLTVETFLLHKYSHIENTTDHELAARETIEAEMSEKPKSSDSGFGRFAKPPVLTASAMAAQHAGLALLFLLYPVVVAREIGLDLAATADFLTATLLAMAIGTFLQSLRAPVGSASLAVMIPTPALIGPIVVAGQEGGMPLICGMMLVLALTSLLMSRVLPYIRMLFPPEVCGVVVVLLGVALAQPALRRITGAGEITYGVHDAQTALFGSGRPDYLIVGLSTLAVIVILSVYSKGWPRLFSIAIGVVAGCIIAWLLGLGVHSEVASSTARGMFGLPHATLTMPSFSFTLMPLFIALGVILSIDDLGVLIGIQKLNDPKWRAIDTEHGSRGIQVTSITGFVAGTLGGQGLGVSSANVGLCVATGTSARVVGIYVGAILFAAAFVPGLIDWIPSIPDPVVGAILCYTSAYMLVAGMELILSRLLSTRRMFVIGFSLLLGLSPGLMPGLYSGLPQTLNELFHSPLAVGAISAVALNLLFQIGNSQTANLTFLDREDPLQFIRDRYQDIGKEWGAGRDIVERATANTLELVETLLMRGVQSTDLSVTLKKNDLGLKVLFGCQNCPDLPFPKEMPPPGNLAGDWQSFAAFSGYLVRKRCSGLEVRNDKGVTQITMLFE